MAIVVAHDLSKKYGDRQALHPTSFILDAGTVTVLAGPNGAGKSTLLKRMTSMVAGADSAATGAAP
ncbi:ATP-binding cassette domain-containing protein [Nocardioides sp. LML1-1-1.1]|uniref:ATP-binding cassette domain-containing protein n=1 Tax=Nocardioides sp. LML1-1-1.1 TaxID=3135248 RepID=UPI00341DA147